MLTYVDFPAPAKLNLTLSIVGQRADGYHLLETVFRFIDLADTVSLAVRTDGLIVLDNPLPDVPPEADLTVRAAKALQAATGCTLGVSIRLTKRIPMGGGLGGGSSDAATVLLALNQLWQVNLSRAALQAIGLTLGADVPVFVFGRPAFAQGIGEDLTVCEVPEAWYVVLYPNIAVPTAKVFSHPDLTRNSPSVIMRSLKTTLRKNDMQRVVCQMFPEVAGCITALGHYGNAMMTGSGGCVFLECSTQAEAETVYQAVSNQYGGFVVNGLQTHPLFGSAH